MSGQDLTAMSEQLLALQLDIVGNCYVCGNDLDPHRLGMDPTSTRHVVCSEP